MKYAKIIALAALAALALIAVAGVGVAPAKYCSTMSNSHTPKTGCALSLANVYDGPFHTDNAGEGGGTANATLTSSFITVTCDSTTQGTLVGTPTTIRLQALTLSSCTSAQASNCSATSTATAANPWHGTGAATGGGNGTMEFSNVGMQFTCTVFGIKTTCIYADSTVGDKGEITLTGGSGAIVKSTNVTLARQAGSGFGCAELGTLSGTYTTTTPFDLFHY